MTTPTLHDYIDLFRRRKAVFLVPFGLLCSAAVAAAMLLPAEYESTANIRVDRQDIPEQLLDGTGVTRYVNEELTALEQEVLSGSNLWKIAEEFDVLPELREENGRSDVIREMRDNTRRQISYVDVDEEARNSEKIAVGFTVSYASADPETAKNVVNAIADLYIEASRQSNREEASQLVEFLREQMQSLDDEIQEYEQELAVFKATHGASLPEFQEFNMQRRENISDSLDRVRERINTLTKQRINLESQMSQVDPHVDIRGMEMEDMSAAQQVDRLRLSYLSLSSRYAPRHPDFGRLRRDLGGLVGEAPGASQLLDLIESAEERRAELIEARRELGRDHPEVASLEEEVGSYHEQIRSMERGSGEDGQLAPDNPAYIALQSELDTVMAELESQQERRDALQARAEEYENRLGGSAEVEREYRVLSRRHDNALEEKRELLDRLQIAESAARLGEHEIGNRFTLISRGGVPEQPARPHRLGIAVLGFVFAAGTSTGFAALAEYMDRTVRGARAVAAVWGAPPLATIPVILNRRERIWRALKRTFWLLVTAAAVGAAVWVWLTYYAPADGLF